MASSSRAFMPLKGNDDALGPDSFELDTYNRASIEEEPEEDVSGSTSDRAGLLTQERAKKTRNPFKSFSEKKLKLTLLISLCIVGAGTIIKYGFLYVDPRRVHSPPWYPTPLGGTNELWKDSYAKAQKLVSQMTLPAKINLTTGSGWQMGPCVGNTGPAYNLEGKEIFPALCYQDGPLGVRFADNITAFPAGLTVAATFNRKLMYERGRAHAKEARDKGVNVLLSPVMGPLGQKPAGGRGWEGFGPDPYLTGIGAAETIRGIQSMSIIAVAKHFILNEQEHFRQNFQNVVGALSSNCDDRTLHELYLWPFADAVKAGVGSVMCSYQKVNNTYACANSKLMNGLLKEELGFQGFVQSDWLAKLSGVEAALAGLDVDMPGDGLIWANGQSLWGSELTKAVLEGRMPLERLNDAVTRIVATFYQIGQDKFAKDYAPNFSSWERTRVGKLFFGSGENDTGIVNQFKDVQGDHKKLARTIAVEGTVLAITQWKKIGVFGLDAIVTEGGPNQCEDRACNSGTLASGFGSGTVEFSYLISPLEAIERKINESNKDISLTTFVKESPVHAVRKTAMAQDLCLIFQNAPGGEGYKSSEGIKGDRNDLLGRSDAFVSEVVRNCKNSVVVIHAVGPVTVEGWVDHDNLKGLIYANLPGQESGNAIVDILFGDANPSGKLPYTVGKSLKDYGPGAPVMYIPNSVFPQADFTEGIFIDYRHLDRHNVTPRYEFGFGLSYTTFELSAIKLTPRVKEKIATAEPVPPSTIKPPRYPTTTPSREEAFFPPGFRKIRKYIYPYIEPTQNIKPTPFKPPKGYEIVHSPSPAGGGEGGNPHLWDVLITIEVSVKNIGNRLGQEVVQLYVSYPTNEPRLATGEDHLEGKDSTMETSSQFVDFPVRQLRGFEKVELKPGQKKTVKMDVKRRDLSYWCSVRQNWIMPTSGPFTFWVGNSSRNLQLNTSW